MDNEEDLLIWGAADCRTSALYITTLHSRIILGLNHSLLEIEAILLSRMPSGGMHDMA